MSAVRIYLLLACLALGGCASTSNNPKDPLESFNRGMYYFNDAVDSAVVKPVAHGYNAVMPGPVKLMLSNFFSNLNDITVAINNLLQLKITNAASDCGRIVINSTVGLFGIIDIATPIGLKKHNEDFGQTLGYWGVSSGPYLMLPFLGPSSIRDGIGLATDSTTDAVWRIDPVNVRNWAATTRAVDARADLLDKEKVLDAAAVDRYAFIRDSYLQRRRSLVYDGDPPREKLEDFEDE